MPPRSDLPLVYYRMDKSHRRKLGWTVSAHLLLNAPRGGLAEACGEVEALVVAELNPAARRAARQAEAQAWAEFPELLTAAALVAPWPPDVVLWAVNDAGPPR